MRGERGVSPEGAKRKRAARRDVRFGFLFSVPAGAAANRAALFRRGNQERGLECFCQFWFWWVSGILVVFRRAKKICPLLCPRLILAYRQNSPADFGASIFFLYALLNSAELAGHRQSHAVPSCSWLSRFAPSPFPREEIMVLVCSPSALIPKPISPRGLHAPGVSPPGCPVGFGV